MRTHGTWSLAVGILTALASGAAAAQTSAGQPAPSPPGAVPSAPGEAVRTPSGRVFLEAWRIAGEDFYDPGMHGVDWEAVRDELLPRAEAAPDGEALSRVINEALARLHASHTGHFTPETREYYELLDVFHPDGIPAELGDRLHRGPVSYVGVGMATREIDGRTFAVDVYEGGPADEAGILVGDELVSVEGGPWSDIAAFRSRRGTPTRVTIQRTPGEAGRLDALVIPERIRPRGLFLSAMRRGARLVERGDAPGPAAPPHRIAIVRVRSYAHSDYHTLLKELLAGPLHDADALVLDLRGGWGGARQEYLDLFNPIVPEMTMRGRDGAAQTFRPTWSKPTVIAIDGGTRSGKEMIADALKTHGIATLVGERTAGAVLAGSVRVLSDGSILYIAVADVEINGRRLEGVGVEPHIVVPRTIPYSAGHDAQLEAAVGQAARSGHASPTP